MRRRSMLIALSLAWIILIAANALAAYLILRNFSTPIPGNWGFRGFQIVFSLVFAGMGTIILWNQPRNIIGWVMLISGGVLTAIQILIIEYAAHDIIVQGDQTPSGLFAAWTTNWFWIPIVGSIVVFLPSYFPDGRLLTKRWQGVIWLTVAGMALSMVAFAVYPGDLTNFSAIENPYGLEGLRAIPDNLLFATQFPMTLGAILGAVSLVLRYRRANYQVRQQLKWFASAAAMIAIGLVFNFVVIATRLAEFILLLSFALMPLAIGIAILRYRLYDIDFIIRRTVSYALVTSILAIGYFGGVTLLQRIVTTITGQQSAVALVITTLAIAALFNPLRRRVQTIVDRRFNRKHYDVQQTLEQFGDQLRDQVDLREIEDMLLLSVQDTLQPESVSLWLTSSERTWN